MWRELWRFEELYILSKSKINVPLILRVEVFSSSKKSGERDVVEKRADSAEMEYKYFRYALARSTNQ